MYFITEPGFCQHFFGNIFEISEKERLFIHFSFIFYASALLCQSLRNADAGRRGGKTALTGLPEVGGEEAAHAAHGVDDLKNKLYYDGFQKMLYHYSHQTMKIRTFSR